jgi:hypothetical protein
MQHPLHFRVQPTPSIASSWGHCSIWSKAAEEEFHFDDAKEEAAEEAAGEAA